MKRKLYSVLLTLCLLLALLPTMVFAEPVFSKDDIAVINAIVANNQPEDMTQAYTDGSSVPPDWEGKVVWNSETPRQVKELSLHEKDMTGTLDVSSLTALEKLDCYNNELTGLNVSGLTALKQLYCHDNELTGIDLSGLTALERLNCSENKLTDLNVSGLTALKQLYCNNSELTGTLDVSGLTALQRLNCSENKLTDLNLSGLTALERLNCSQNKLTDLNLSGLTALKQLYCFNNELTGTLDVSGLAALETLTCYENKLTGITLNYTAPYQHIDVSYNYMSSESAVTGKEITWDGMYFIFAPQAMSELATPTGLRWGAEDDAIFAEWDKVDGVKYSVEVFKDGTSVFQSPEPVNRRFIEVTSVLISSGSGTYTFRVKALGDGVATTDSDWSALSPERAYTEETAPPEETESTEGDTPPGKATPTDEATPTDKATPTDQGETLPVTGENFGSYLWLSLLPLLIGGLLLALRKEKLSKQKD